MADSESKLEFSESGSDEGSGEEEEAALSYGAGGADSSHELEETQPLNNTPPNIARVEDEIEHSIKYSAQTKSPSDGGDVRWYFCKVPLEENELAASVPRSVVVRKSDYFRFGMRDSLAIEASFLQREDELLSVWWKEYAECSEGPRERPGFSKNLKIKSNLPSAEGAESAKLYDSEEEERVGIPVKGGLYEVDLVKRHYFPVYWSGENKRVLRGHWFAHKRDLGWLPICKVVAEQLEIAYRSQVWHRRTFQPCGLFAARVDLQGFTMGLHALFTGEDDTWEAMLNDDSNGFCGSGNGIKLRRGYAPSHFPKQIKEESRQLEEEEMDDYCSQVPVGHLVFMVHGVGQTLKKSNLVDDVRNFSHITSSLAERHLTSYQRDTQRILFIPCQWRRGLKLSGETAVQKITLDSLQFLRDMLSATVHDVLYYMSSVYCQDIINSVSNQLNRMYLKFIKRNPDYDGKVSIYGHSLGSVISYDILCHQEVMSSPFPTACMYEDARSEGLSVNVHNNKNSAIIAETEKVVDPVDEDKMSTQPSLVRDVSGGGHSGHEKMIVNMPKQANSEMLPQNQKGPKSYTPHINYTKLEFKVDTFFAAGSPLGVFLAIRNIRIGIGKGQEYWEEENILREEMPSCRQMFNILHPCDLGSNRIEPLVCKEYSNKRPVIIPYHKGGRRLRILLQEFSENMVACSQSVKDQLNSVWVKALTICQSRKADLLEEAEENDQQKEETSYGSLMMERVTGGAGRVDHILQDNTFIPRILQIFRAHTNYWGDHDTALFILKHLYRDIPNDPNNSLQ